MNLDSQISICETIITVSYNCVNSDYLYIYFTYNVKTTILMLLLVHRLKFIKQIKIY